MQHAVLDLLRAALIPELGADITAGAAGDVQLVLVAVAALGALPQLLLFYSCFLSYHTYMLRSN